MIERNYFVFPVSQFEQRCYRTKVDVLEWGFPDWNTNGFENSTGKEFFLLPID